jgi:hypothetical protein
MLDIEQKRIRWLPVFDSIGDIEGDEVETFIGGTLSN